MASSGTYDELIAQQQLKLKDAQKAINAGFEQAYETLRSYQNQIAVAKVAEAEHKMLVDGAEKAREGFLVEREAAVEKREEEVARRLASLDGKGGDVATAETNECREVTAAEKPEDALDLSSIKSKIGDMHKRLGIEESESAKAAAISHKDETQESNKPSSKSEDETIARYANTNFSLDRKALEKLQADLLSRPAFRPDLHDS